MKKFCLLSGAMISLILSWSTFSVWGQSSKTPKLSGSLLKEKMAAIEVLQETPTRAYARLGPLWASKSSMESTLKDLKKQAAKMGADAIIDLKVRTEKLQTTTYDPGLVDYGGGVGPYAGWWGGMNYWGGYAQSHTYVQPVITGWAVRWE